MIRLCSSTTECSISESMISQSAPIDVNGPMKLSMRRVPAPMIAGPRTVELMQLRARLDDHPTLERGSLVDGAVDARLDRLEHEPVALEQRVHLAGVDPPAVEDLVAHPVAVVDEPLDGVGDLELAAGRRLDRAARRRGSCGSKR